MRNQTFKFAFPIVIENIVSVAVSMIYSSITGAISKSSLAAAGVGNQAMSLIAALLALLSTGAAVLTAREIGRRDYAAASRTAEHTMFLAPVLSAGIMLVLLAVSSPTMKLLMPGAEESFLKEGSLYYRTMLFSVPGLAITNSCASLLRASGDSRSPLVGAFSSCVVQLLTVRLFTGVMNLGIVGTAYAIICCRYVNAAVLVLALLKSHRTLAVEPRNILRPQSKYIKQIFSVGLPASFDSIAVQVGYVSVNSILVSMGTLASGVVNVLNAVLLLTGITQSIGSCISTTLVGQTSGAGDIAGARRKMWRILLWCEGVSMVLCLVTVIIPGRMAAYFTSDPEIYEASRNFMWVLFPYCVVAVGCNVSEPSCRAGGDVRFIAKSIVCCVLLIRLPLTILLCMVLKLNYYGIYIANIFSLAVRFSIAMVRMHTSKWGRSERQL